MTKKPALRVRIVRIIEVIEQPGKKAPIDAADPVQLVQPDTR